MTRNKTLEHIKLEDEITLLIHDLNFMSLTQSITNEKILRRAVGALTMLKNILTVESAADIISKLEEKKK